MKAYVLHGIGDYRYEEAEVPSVESSISVSEIAATPAIAQLTVNETKKISVVGLRGGLYSNVSLETADCVITSEDAAVATVADGIITGVSAGTTYINVDYNGVKDIIKVVVTDSTN